jgi:hypothetical protein
MKSLKIKEKIQMTKTHGFGGNWTEEKLKRVEKCLKVYAPIINKQDFRFAYIDAFTGNNVKKIIY